MSILFLLTVALQQPPSAPARPQPLQPEPAIEWLDLPLELPQELRDSVRFGYLEVPQDHADPSGPRIRIAILLVPARGADRVPDPVVSIAGGPGLPAIRFHMELRKEGRHPLDAFRERRDLIIMDTRGHGYSEPQTCPELGGGDLRLSEDSAALERLWLAKLEACRNRLEAAGARLHTLSSVQAAHDLEWLRRALGAPRLNLVGLSYGSRIAAEAVRQVPSSIRTVYLSGPAATGRPGDVNWPEIAAEVLGTLFRRCASQADCRTAYPRLEADYDSVMARLRRRPERVPVPRTEAAPDGSVVVTAELMQEGFAQILLNRRLAAGAPLLIHTLAEHGLAPLGAMAGQLMGEIGDTDVAPGTFLAFWCNDGRVSRASSEQLQRRCRAWIGEAWDGRPAEPVRSGVPALIETGELDPRTPPSNARFLAAGLPRAHVVILPWYGHERPPDCALRIARAFLDAPGDPPDVACLDSIPPIEFVTGVKPSRWVGNAVHGSAARPWLAALPGTAVLLLLVPFVGIPLRAIRARRRGQRHQPSIATLALLAVATVGLILVLGLAAALFAGMRRHFFIPAIGLQQEWIWLLALPWLLLVLTPLAAVLALSGRFGTGEPSALLRWSGLLGAALLLAVWFATLVS
ncbi:MAG TPA: alpha/beta fold hydrolase [Longimicrobiales bacterium]|nr:alpha/beta fold hydrolase [Longimicrobiales bacterium]